MLTIQAKNCVGSTADKPASSAHNTPVGVGESLAGDAVDVWRGIVGYALRVRGLSAEFAAPCRVQAFSKSCAEIGSDRPMPALVSVLFWWGSQACMLDVLMAGDVQLVMLVHSAYPWLG